MKHWKELLIYFQDLNEDVGGIVLDYLHVFLKKRTIGETIHNYGQMYLNSLSLNGNNYNNTMRHVLKNKISRDKKPLPNRMIWMTPIDTIHKSNYYITGILGQHQNLPGACRGGPPRNSIKFRIPYAYLVKLCREYGLKIPSDNNPVSSKKINRFLMDIEEDFISHRN